MGTSDPANKPWIKQKIAELNPKTVLDVGAGQGVYLDICKSIRPDIHVTGIEVWLPYIEQFNLANRYDTLIKRDIRHNTDWNYDLVIFGDVLEHMTTEEAVQCYNNARESGANIILSLPIIHYHQDAINGNPYEKHVREDWTTQEVLQKFEGITEYEEFPVTGAFLAKHEKNFMY